MIDARSPRLVVPCTTLALALVALTLWCGGPRGIAYLVVYGLALLPGLPIGWRLFGRGPTGWVAGALVGYGLTALGRELCETFMPLNTFAKRWKGKRTA